MRERTTKVLRADGSHMRWVALEEALRLVADGQAVRVSRRKAPQQVFQLLAFPEPSESKRSKTSLTLADASVLATLRPREVTGLRTEDLREMPAHRVEVLQRLAGWNLIPRSEALENFSPEA